MAARAREKPQRESVKGDWSNNFGIPPAWTGEREVKEMVGVGGGLGSLKNPLSEKKSKLGRGNKVRITKKIVEEGVCVSTYTRAQVSSKDQDPKEKTRSSRADLQQKDSR